MNLLQADPAFEARTDNHPDVKRCQRRAPDHKDHRQRHETLVPVGRHMGARSLEVA